MPTKDVGYQEKINGRKFRNEKMPGSLKHLFHLNAVSYIMRVKRGFNSGGIHSLESVYLN